MNGNNCNSDKVTIKVQLPGDDYHDISIDWSTENFRRQIFHQFAAYTGIPVKYTSDIYARRNLIEWKTIGNIQFEEIDDDDDDIDFLQGDSKEDLMNFFHDGDCFILQTSLYQGNGGLYISYSLQHIDLVNETGCTIDYCHYGSSRTIADRMAKLIKSDHIRAKMKRNVSYGWLADRLYFNFKQYSYLNCSERHPRLQRPFDLPYLRNRG